MLKTFATLLVLALGALLIFAATRPDTFRVQRMTRIEAPPDRIHPLIDDMHRFNTWNPYLKKDPNATGRYAGPGSGAGAAYAFEGNKDVGKGSLRILESSKPERVTMQLDMLEPFAGQNTVEFKLVPRGGATDVIWSMHGSAPFISKLVGVFIDIDRMVGRDFEAGLANLKTIAEQR